MTAFLGTRTIANGATAVSLDAAIRAAPGANQVAAYAGSGIGCALNFYGNGDLYVGTDSTITDSNGGVLLSANTPFTDYAIAQFGNVVDITQLYVYAPTGSNVTLTVYFRAL